MKRKVSALSYQISVVIVSKKKNMGNTCTAERDKCCSNCRLILKIENKATQTDPGSPPPRMRDTASNTDHPKQIHRGPRKRRLESTADILTTLFY